MQFVIRTILIFGISLSVSLSVKATEPVKYLASLSGSILQPSFPMGASLKQIYGTVLVNHGKGYSVAHLDMEINIGDRVLTMDGAQAVVVQSDGCVITLRGNSIFILKDLSACPKGKQTIKKIGPYYARAIGSEAVTDVVPTVSEEALENSPLDTSPQETDTFESVEEQIEQLEQIDQPIEAAETAPMEVETIEAAEILEEESIEVASEVEGGSFFSSLSTTQIVVTGIAVGLGLAVVGSSGSSGGGGGAVSGQ